MEVVKPESNMAKIALPVKCLLICLIWLTSTHLNGQTATYWKATEGHRTYAIKLTQKDISITTDDGSEKHTSTFKIHEKSGKRYFYLDKEKMCLGNSNGKLHLDYCVDKIRVAVNEIVTLTFSGTD